MKTANLLSLFSGIGAFEKGIKDAGWNYKLVGFSELTNNQVTKDVYCAIHGENHDKDIGEIQDIHPDMFNINIDIITHGSPCQDFSTAGLQKGGDKESGTRSSLMWETVRIIKETRPKIVIWENVKGVLNKNNKHNFEKYVKTMSELGYYNSWDVRSGIQHGIPQDRERLFVVSLRKDITNEPFDFKNIPENNITDIRGFVETNTNNRQVRDKIKPFFKPCFFKDYNSQNYKKKLFDGVEQGYMGSSFSQNRIWSVNGAIPTITTRPEINIYELGGRLTTLECWRLMGFGDEDYQKAKQVVVEKYPRYRNPDNILGQMAGNSIITNIIRDIFIEIEQQLGWF